MSNLSSQAFTGDTARGNPYQGDLGKGIDYDRYEANISVIVQDGAFPEVLSVYRAGARKLVKFSSAKIGDNVLEAGFGTGILTLELLAQQPTCRVIGIEISEGMMQVARYKFHLDEGKELLANITDQRLLDYWHKFRAESLRYKGQVVPLRGDIQTFDNFLASESFDAAIANQVVHWTDPSKTFAQLNRYLKRGGEFIWNSASHWYNDAKFPSLQYGFRFNDFLKYVLDEVSENVEVRDIYALPIPKQDFNSIRTITSAQGFDTEQLSTWLVPIDLQVFVQNHVPVCVKQLMASPIDEEKANRIIAEAIAKTITNPHALKDTQHKYDIVPILRSIKK